MLKILGLVIKLLMNNRKINRRVEKKKNEISRATCYKENKSYV